MVTAAVEKSPSLGAIATDQSYPLPVFMRLTGLSLWVMRQARRGGLKLRTVGRRKFVLGSDWAEYLAKQEG
jgi:hypothetical protein